VTYSQTSTRTTTFSLSNAKYVASKVQTDLRQLQRWYGHPSDARIANYHGELVVLSAGGFVELVKYGFRREDAWILTVEYRFRYDGTLVGDSRAGGVRSSVNLQGAVFGSWLEHTRTWDDLSRTEREAVEANLPFKRVGAEESPYVAGSYMTDRTYSSNGSGASRRRFVAS
jgi:hypothetical protein